MHDECSFATATAFFTCRYNLEDAEFREALRFSRASGHSEREERRWMERQNQRVRKKRPASLLAVAFSL